MGTTGCHQSKIKHDKPRTRSIFLGCSVCNGQTPNNYNHGGTQDGYTGTVITCLVRIMLFYCIEQLQETLNDMPSMDLLPACDGHKHTDDLFRTCPLMWTNVCFKNLFNTLVPCYFVWYSRSTPTMINVTVWCPHRRHYSINICQKTVLDNMAEISYSLAFLSSFVAHSFTNNFAISSQPRQVDRCADSLGVLHQSHLLQRLSICYSSIFAGHKRK